MGDNRLSIEILDILDRLESRSGKAARSARRALMTCFVALGVALLAATMASELYFWHTLSPENEVFRAPFAALPSGISLLAIFFCVREWLRRRDALEKRRVTQEKLQRLLSAGKDPQKIREILAELTEGRLAPQIEAMSSPKGNQKEMIAAPAAEQQKPVPAPRGTQMTLRDLIDLLEEDGWQYDMPDENVLRLYFQGSNTNLQAQINFQPDREAILAMILLPQKVPLEDARLMCEMIARINYELLFGNFEIDVDTGELRYRTSMPVDDAPFFKNQFRTIFYTAFKTTDRYYPALMSVLFGNRSPDQAMRDIEGR